MTLDASYPVALLPVRLETRFDGTLLKVRIFPDDIFADTHEPALTAEERADGTAYRAAAQAGTAAEQQAWGRLAGRWTAPRAAFIAAAVTSGVTASRAESWTRAAQAQLPDRWVVRAYQGGNVFTVTSGPVRQPLALTLSPGSAAADRVTVSDRLSIDSGLLWTVDFAAAQAAGMAVTIDLTKPDAVTGAAPDPGAGLDLLLAVGTSDSQTPAAGAAQLRALFDAHHYTRGLAFLRPGTPTNNTPDAPAAFPPADPGGAASFAVERAAPLVSAGSSPGSNGVLFARALGLPLAPGEQVAAVEHLDRSAADHDAAAAAMNDALWPATLGYCMEQLMASQFDAAAIGTARQFWAEQVRPGGPLPAFRVGRVPYGLLPAVCLDRLPASSFITALRSLRDRYFLPAAGLAPRIAAGSADPDGDLLQVLALQPSSRAVRTRVLLGEVFTSSTAAWLGSAAAEQEQARHEARIAAAESLLGTVGLGPEAALSDLDPASAAELIGAPLVTSAPLSEQIDLDGPDGTGVNYIRWLHDNAITGRADVRSDALPGSERPLLYRLLRHALLAEMDRIAFERLAAANVVTATDRPEVELVGLTSADTRLTSYQRIDRAATDAAFPAALAPYLSRLAVLAGLPTAELDRRFGESLDACSHRLDAWITAVATQRLWSLRASAPAGCHLGAFGWAENIRPAPSGPPAGGYIHAPSAAQAAAAAVLRSGYLSRGGSGSAYQVNLSSARVRDALELLDATRQGEPLAALLGQRFERDLRQRGLELLIAPLREYFPLVAGKTPEGDGPAELVGARNVVDGLALRGAWNSQATPFSAASQLPGLSPEQLSSLHAALDSLSDSVDPVADVLTAESVFQAVRGNPAAAAASLDAMAQGVLPPRPEVVRTPLSGASFTQRLVVALDASATPAAGPWGPRTPRALAEPFADHWAGTLLGAPSAIGCRVVLPDGSTREVPLAALQLRPLDLVALAATPPSGLSDGELDRRVLDAAAAPPGSQVQYDSTSLRCSLAAALEAARAVAGLLAAARPLAPADLAPAAGAAAAQPDPSHAAAAATRARASLDQLNAAAAAIDQAAGAVTAALSGPAPPADGQVAALRAALRRAAAFGIPGAYPAAGLDAAGMAALAAGVRKELASRQAAAGPAPPADPAALIAAAAASVRAVFGPAFPFLPAFAAPALAQPLAAPADLAGQPGGPRQALQQLARVRPSLGRWRSLWLYAQALGAPAPALEIVQLPAAQPWAGSAAAASVPAGTLSLIVHRPTQAPPDRGWAGLLIDEWVETIPSPVQHTALAFRYEAPVAEAPQAVLLAVPPAAGPAWDTGTLLDTVRDTLTLAKIRAVDGSRLDALRPFLPAIFLTANTENESISTDFLGSLVAEPMLRSS